ncbi:MAG: hypothetical protein K8L99_02495 [Anaerolineae bacterium]|nr:hypothetical protein [Anaerolineae bacterium]
MKQAKSKRLVIAVEKVPEISPENAASGASKLLVFCLLLTGGLLVANWLIAVALVVGMFLGAILWNLMMLKDRVAGPTKTERAIADAFHKRHMNNN